MISKSRKRLMKIFVIVEFVSILFQSGCIVASSASWPLWLPGAMIGRAGIVMTSSGFFTHSVSDYRDGMFFTMVGIILGNEEPNRIFTLNELPRGNQLLMNQLHVNNDDLEAYNENLNQIQKIVIEIMKDIQIQKSRFKTMKFSLSELKQDSEFSSICKKYGFEDTATFIASFKQSKLSQKQVESFSGKMNLPLAQAKILLFHVLGADIESEF